MANNAAGNYLGSGTKLDGVVPGMTWASFINSFPSASSLSSNSMEGGANVAGLGPVAARRLLDTNNVANYGGGEGNSGGFANAAYGAYNDYAQPVGDGTQNVFTQGPNGELISKNNTIDTDSWWDRAGLPMLASLAFGGATGLAAGLGVGVSGLGAGAVNVGAGLSSLGLEGGSLAGAANAGIGAGFGGANDIASASYNPYSPANWTADAGGATLSDGVSTFPIGTEAGAAGGGLTLGDAALGAGGLGSAGSAASSLWGNPEDAFVQPTNAATATQQIADSGNNMIQGGSTTTTNPFQAISNLYNNGLTNGSPSDYLSLASGAGSLINGILGYTSANKAADAQTNAANQSNALAASIYGNNVSMNAPFVKTGTTANNTLGDLYGTNGAAAQTAAYGNFKTSPNYQFALDQGTHAVQNSASAAGGLYSGRAAKDLENYGQGLASQQYGQYTSGLQNLSATGQAAANQQAANGNQYVSNVTSNNGAIGNAQAAGSIAGTNAITGALSGALGQSSSNALINALLKQSGNGYYAT